MVLKKTKPERKVYVSFIPQKRKLIQLFSHPVLQIGLLYFQNLTVPMNSDYNLNKVVFNLFGEIKYILKHSSLLPVCAKYLMVNLDITGSSRAYDFQLTQFRTK